MKRIHSRPVWIISDRGTSAGDNGESLFRHIMTRKDCPADIYFAISTKSPDYPRVKQIGPVLDYGSLRYKLKFLLADKIISSHADTEVTNPYVRQIDHYVNLYNFDFIFLQHGVIRNDLSGWLNRFEKNIKLFVTSSEQEHLSILHSPYYYQQDNLMLTGLPRYDYLDNNPKNKIIVAPTYRASLLKFNTNQLGSRPYNSEFKNSQYFKFYQSLLSDDRLLKSLEENSAEIEFYLHPNFASQIEDFRGNNRVAVARYPYNYRQALSEGSLLVTDYSSVAFDFAYLGKPVIYSQFDSGTFFDGQVYTKGYFDDKLDGFGPVCHEYESLIDSIIQLIEDGLVMDSTYQQRADNFFRYRDKNNCRRVYDELVKDL